MWPKEVVTLFEFPLLPCNLPKGLKKTTKILVLRPKFVPAACQIRSLCDIHPPEVFVYESHIRLKYAIL